MADFQREIIALVIQYLKDTTNWDATPEDITADPWHKTVALWWDAQVHYGMNDFHSSLDQVEPKEGKTVHIRTKKGCDRFEYRKGKWESIGDITESMYKD
jgi:hypothetical protein